MGSDARGGITRSGSSGSYSYTTKTNMGDKPVNYVSFWDDAAGSANWLHNGMPSGAQDATTTEDGAYDLTDATAVTNNTVTRKAGATYFIPSEDEWYKAAYYDPEDPLADGNSTTDYWLYPTQSDTDPTPATATATGDVSNPGANVANYSYGADWNGQNGNVTTVGTAGNTSHYGAYDFGGNVWEWNESITSEDRGLRGGSWNFHGVHNLQSSSRDFSSDPTSPPRSRKTLWDSESQASPEPSRGGPVAAESGGLLSTRRRGRSSL